MTALANVELGPPRSRVRQSQASDEQVGQLAQFGVATVHEAYLRRGLMTGLNPLSTEQSVCGPAITALCHAGDNLMLHAAIARCEPGDVLVVATLAPSTHGMFGDLLATLCRARGVAGLVIDAGVRDTQIIRELGFPVWSKAISAAGATRQAAGWVNVPVVCGGVLVNPGDVIRADADGVVVVGQADADAVVRGSEERERNEELIRADYAAGKGKDVSAVLAQAGVIVDPS